MKTIYPSKNFLTDARRALNAHEIFEISIKGDWRGRMLAKEVGEWLPFDEVELIKKGTWKAPSVWCGLLMMLLHATHYMALSANYEMRSSVDGDSVVITYLPL
ncbi:hypothetical protein [Paraherbaspirillum soli]|uniref:Uncharacterized protein n=1 Tax=Paraherbaspirillum soli TaxID=631222 RepID=A0ABW0MCJ2_9BURK